MLNKSKQKRRVAAKAAALLFFLRHEKTLLLLFIQHLKIFLDRRIDSFDDCWDESCFF